MRLSTQFFGTGFRLAAPAPIVRAQIGPRSRAEAKGLAQQLAALCQTLCAAAADIWKATPMNTQPLDNDETALVQQVVNACENAIKEAVAQPSRAVGLAKGFGAALTSLQLIQSEVAKGENGAAAVTANADALTRHALTEILKVAAQPKVGFAALAAIGNVAPNVADVGAAPSPAVRLKSQPDRVLPLFSKISQDYIDMRVARSGGHHADIPMLKLRRQTFLDVIGDATPDHYVPSDLQTYVNRMRCWPANVSKRGEMAGKTTLEILEANKQFKLKPMTRNTMQGGYVTNIRTMMRYGMPDHHYRDPFAGAQITYPETLAPPRPREGVSAEVTNRVFKVGVASGLLDEAMLPPLAKLTSRRLGLLTHLQGGDIRQKHGVWIAQTDGIVEVEINVEGENGETRKATAWRRVPLKTSESMTFYVLHNFFVEIGFVDWMRVQRGFVFAAAHEHADPSKYMSKVLQNHMARCGAAGGEVFHSLRGDAIDGMRDADVQNRTRRLQAGHELGDEHDKYGFRALSAAECQRLANLPLPEDIDWSVFKNKLDFEAMAGRRRARGRRPK
jgi:hypothetical protein